MEMDLMSKTDVDQFSSGSLQDMLSCQPIHTSTGLWDYNYPVSYYNYYPSPCFHYSDSSKNSFEQAFKVIQKLMNKNLLKLNTIKQFMDAVSEIAAVL